MTNDIDIKWNSRHNEVMQGINAMMGAVDKLAGKIDTIGRKQNASSQQTATMWGRINGTIGKSVLGLAGFSSGLAAVYTVTRLISGEFEKIHAAAKKAAEINIAGGQSFAPMNVNMMLDEKGSGGVTNEADFNRLKDQMKRDVLLNEAEANQVYSNALSARGSLNINQMNDFIRTAGQLLPGNAEAIETLAARAMDISKVTGNTNAKQIISSILETQAASRAVRVDDLAENIMTPLLATISKGGTYEEGAEFFAGLTQLTGDVTPEKSRTAAIAFMQKMDEFVPERQMVDRRGKRLRIEKDVIEQYEQARDKSPAQALQVLESDSNLGEAFLAASGSMGKGAMLPALEALVMGDPKAMAQMRAAQSKIGPLGNAAAQQQYDEMVRRLAENDRVGVMKADKMNQISEEEWAFSATGVKEAQKAMYVKQAEKVIDQTNTLGPDVLRDYIDKGILTYKAEADPSGAARGELGWQYGTAAGDAQYANENIGPAIDAVRRMDETFAKPAGRNQQQGGKERRR